MVLNNSKHFIISSGFRGSGSGAGAVGTWSLSPPSGGHKALPHGHATLASAASSSGVAWGQANAFLDDHGSDLIDPIPQPGIELPFVT